MTKNYKLKPLPRIPYKEDTTLIITHTTAYEEKFPTGKLLDPVVR